MPELTTHDVEPLLAGSYVGPSFAWEALLATRPTWGRAAEAEARRRASRASGAEDLVQAAQLRLVDKADRHRGLRRPEEGDLVDPGRWLRRTVLRQVVDAARRGRARDVPASTLFWPPDAPPTPEDAVDVGRRIALVRGVLRDPAMPATQALACACLYLPDLVDEALVVRAADPPSARGGLARDPADTWRRLQAWIREVEPGCSDPDARCELAFVLRSDSLEAWSAWRRKDPEACNKAVDTVRKWAERGWQHVRARVGEGSGHPVSRGGGSGRRDVQLTS